MKMRSASCAVFLVSLLGGSVGMLHSSHLEIAPPPALSRSARVDAGSSPGPLALAESQGSEPPVVPAPPPALPRSACVDAGSSPVPLALTESQGSEPPVVPAPPYGRPFNLSAVPTEILPHPSAGPLESDAPQGAYPPALAAAPTVLDEEAERPLKSARADLHLLQAIPGILSTLQ